MNDEDIGNEFELALRILGNEVIAIKLASNSFASKWLLTGFASLILLVSVIALFGQDLANFITSFN